MNDNEILRKAEPEFNRAWKMNFTLIECARKMSKEAIRLAREDMINENQGLRTKAARAERERILGIIKNMRTPSMSKTSETLLTYIIKEISKGR